jgi:hypothetical protein
MQRRYIATIVKTSFILAFLTSSFWVFAHRQDIFDWWRLSSYKPAASIAALADATTMIGRGRELFYVSDPQVNEREAFNGNCNSLGEEGLVLGCYKLQRIYIFNVADPRLNGVKEVTAAHEMLHAAYERLDGPDKAKVNKSLETQLAAIQNERLQALIKLYNEHEPGELLNEMHSILGTEFGNLSPELETYYKRYFSDRAKVVALANGYEAIFTQSKQRIASFDAELDALKAQIEAGNKELEHQKATLEASSAQLDSLRRDDPAAYNQAVPAHNAKVRTFNNLATATRNLVEKYNTLVQQRNQEVAGQSELYNSLDSRYQPISR